MSNLSRKTPLNSFLNALTTIIFVLALVFTVVAVGVTLTSRGGEVSLLGWKPYVVLSDSMQSEFEVGDIAVSGPVDVNEIKQGDIITFASIDPDSYGEVFTHKVREVTEYEGELAFVTYGTTTGDNDAYPALASRVTGRYAFHIPRAGYVFDFFKSPAGYVVLVLIPFSILIGLQIRNIVRLVKEGRAQAAQALAAEQRRVQEMQAEIDRLRYGQTVAYANAPRRGKHARPSD
ncbi:MAG: signal peptidase I [Eggerthellaceae bacterium]|nr:signal peptidase I [Eggerthellaceae bacterium]